jgi:hypothetical protein
MVCDPSKVRWEEVRQEDGEFQASQAYRVRQYLKNKQTQQQKTHRYKEIQ